MPNLPVPFFSMVDKMQELYPDDNDELGKCIQSRVESNGVCYGYSISFVYAVLTNTLEHFISLNQRLRDFPAGQLAKDPRGSSTFRGLFETILFHQSPQKFKEFFDKADLVEQSEVSVHYLSQFTAPLALQAKGGVFRLYEEPQQTLEKNIQRLIAICALAKQSNYSFAHEQREPWAVLLSLYDHNVGHAIAISYNTNNNSYICADSGGALPYMLKEIPENELAKGIREICSTINHDSLAIDMYTTKDSHNLVKCFMNEKNSSGKIALIQAMEEGEEGDDTEFSKFCFLLQNGADPFQTNRYGSNVFDRAKTSARSKELALILEPYNNVGKTVLTDLVETNHWEDAVRRLIAQPSLDALTYREKDLIIKNKDSLLKAFRCLVDRTEDINEKLALLDGVINEKNALGHSFGYTSRMSRVVLFFDNVVCKGAALAELIETHKEFLEQQSFKLA